MSFQQTTLKKLVKAHYGKALKKSDRIESGDVKVYGSSGHVGQHTSKLCGYPTLIVGRKGSVGEVVWAPDGGWIIDTAFFIEILDQGILNLRYLFYALKRANLARRSITTSIPGLNRDDFYNTEIPLPPLPEQKRIAAILDKADQLRQKRQQAIGLADEFLRSVFLDMFGDLAFNPHGYKKIAIEELGVDDGIKCGPFGTQLGKHEYRSEGVPLWGIKHVNRDFKIETDEFLTLEKAAELEAYSIRENDIVMTRKGTVGNCHVYPEGMEHGVMHSDLLRIRADSSKIDPHFLSWQLKLSRDVTHQLSLISSGAIMAGINVTKLKKLQVHLPDYELQVKFRKILFKQEELKKKYTMGDFDLFNSLSQKAFAGEL